MKANIAEQSMIARLGLGRILVSAAVFSISLSTLAVGVTGAVFTDSESMSDNTFTTGTVDISTSPASEAVSLPEMAPGDQVTAPLTVSNDGSLELRYSLTSTTSEDALAGQLEVTVKTGVSECTDAEFGTDGNVVYGPGALGSTGGTSLIGSRVLSATASEVLCVQVALPIGTGNAFQGLTTTATFDFEAEQTANN